MRLTSWILVLTITVSPLMAQNRFESATTYVDVSHTSITELVGESRNPSKRTSVLSEPAVPPRDAAFRNMANRSTAAALPEAKAPGDTKWVILAALLGAAAVAGVILLWPGGGDNGKPEGPAGTVIAPGSPTVGTPNR